MVTQQRFTTTVCAPGKCRVCDGREAAALGIKTRRGDYDRASFYAHALEANAVRLRQLVDKGKDPDVVTGQLRRVFAFGRLTNNPVFFEEVTNA